MDVRPNVVAILTYGEASKDVDEIKARLGREGLKTASPADMHSDELRARAIQSSRTIVLVVAGGIDAVAEGRLERDLVTYRQTSSFTASLVPVLTSGTVAPNGFAGFAWVRLAKGRESGLALVVSQCRQRSLGASRFRTESAGIRAVAVREESETVSGPVCISKDGARIAYVTVSGQIRTAARDHADPKAAPALPDDMGRVTSLKFSVTDSSLLFGTDRGFAGAIDLTSGECTVGISQFQKHICAIDINHDGTNAAVSIGSRTIVFSVPEGKVLYELVHAGEVCILKYSRDGKFILAGTIDGQAIVWKSGLIKPIFFAQGYKSKITGIDLIQGTKPQVLVCSEDSSINIWDLDEVIHSAVLEGHTAACTSVHSCEEAGIIVSTAIDQTIRFWNISTGQCISVEFLDSSADIAITPSGEWFTWVANSPAVRFMKFNIHEAYSRAEDNVQRYANAKVLVVGESGAGKTGLTIRLTEDNFRPTASTDAAWASHLQLPTFDYPELENREIWLWDFAGQSDYRLIHQIFMDEAALALMVFNGQQEDPLVGISQWNADISRAARKKTRKILVLARSDRGGLTVSRQDIDRFCEENHYSGYFETSAQTGAGCDQLRRAIVESIDWSTIPRISSPAVFRALKDEIISIRDSGSTLIRRDELRQQLEFRFAARLLGSQAAAAASDVTLDRTLPAVAANNGPEMRFDDRELDAVISLLVGPGLVKRLEFGDFIVLRPERINQYASALIRSVRQQAEEMGWIESDKVLRGEIDFPADDSRLAPADEQVLLTAMVQMLVGRGICFPQSAPSGQLLVFPYLFRKERPESSRDFVPLVQYSVQGPLHEIYATLVVKLSLHFGKHRLWRNSAEFETNEQRIIGVQLSVLSGGSGTVSLYFGEFVPDDTKVTFIRFAHDHLYRFDSNVVRHRNYECRKCGEVSSDRRMIDFRLKSGAAHIFCGNCGAKILLRDLIETNFSAISVMDEARKLEIQLKGLLDNESKELKLLGHAMSIVASAGQIFRPTSNSDWGIDGEIEFKDNRGRAAGKRVYVQLKSGDSYLRFRRGDGETFRIKNPAHVEYWREQSSPVWLVVETSDGVIRWMNISKYLRDDFDDYVEREKRLDVLHYEAETVRLEKNKLKSREDDDATEESFFRRTKRPATEYHLPLSVKFDGDPFDVASIVELRNRTFESTKRKTGAGAKHQH